MIASRYDLKAQNRVPSYYLFTLQAGWLLFVGSNLEHLQESLLSVISSALLAVAISLRRHRILASQDGHISNLANQSSLSTSVHAATVETCLPYRKTHH